MYNAHIYIYICIMHIMHIYIHMYNAHIYKQTNEIKSMHLFVVLGVEVGDLKKSEQNVHSNFYIWGFANCVIKR